MGASFFLCLGKLTRHGTFIRSLHSQKYHRRLMQVVDFAGLMRFFHQATSSLLTSTNCMKSVKLGICSLDNQLASSLLTTCNRFVITNPEQKIRILISA